MATTATMSTTAMPTLTMTTPTVTTRTPRVTSTTMATALTHVFPVLVLLAPSCLPPSPGKLGTPSEGLSVARHSWHDSFAKASLLGKGAGAGWNCEGVGRGIERRLTAVVIHGPLGPVTQVEEEMVLRSEADGSLVTTTDVDVAQPHQFLMNMWFDDHGIFVHHFHPR
eukprot:4447834-Pyramimonas_sp.AAC.1